MFSSLVLLDIYNIYIIRQTRSICQRKNMSFYNTLHHDHTLHRGQQITSNNGTFIAIMQHDGNFVLYEHGRPLWASNTVGRGTRCIMQSDGNLVVYDNQHPTWASNTHGKGGHYLIVQNDGNLVLYDRHDKPLWASNTNR